MSKENIRDQVTVHEHIYNLDSSIVASPNFDDIYDTYARTTSFSTVVIKDHTSNDIANYLLGGECRLILKTHGSANNPQEIIFTRKDYAQARTKYVLFYEILKSLALTHTFIFLGCGTDDPDIRMLFEDIQFTHGRMPYHYMTLPKEEVHSDPCRQIRTVKLGRFWLRSLTIKVKPHLSWRFIA